MSEYGRCDYVYLEIRNNTSGRYLFCPAFVFPTDYDHGIAEFQSLSHCKIGVDDPTFDNGDDVSISVLPHHPAIHIIFLPFIVYGTLLAKLLCLNNKTSYSNSIPKYSPQAKIPKHTTTPARPPCNA
jgi:hypothetical protein